MPSGVSVLRRGSSTPEPAPAWLDSASILQILPDNRGYAEWSASGAQSRLRLRGADGTICAELDVPVTNPRLAPGGTIVGRDLSGTGFRVWRRALR